MIFYGGLLAFAVPTFGGVVLGSRGSSNANDSKLSYAPIHVQCPQRQWIRDANGLSEEEAAWVCGRKLKVIDGLETYINNLHLTNFNQHEYIDRLRSNPEKIPTIGFAISGGAYASSLTGTGILRAFDARFQPAVEQRTGGILQILTYFTGLSGGSLPVMSLATNNFPLVDDMVVSWRLDQQPVDGTVNTAHRTTTNVIMEQLSAKFKAGYNVSFADYLGRNLGYQFVAGAEGGIGVQVSDIVELSNFKNFEMPMPMWECAESTVHDAMLDGLVEPSYNSTVFELSPFEFGAWTGPEAFFPTRYLGTKMANGHPVSECVEGFDNAGFFLGVVGDAWNYWLLSDLTNNTQGRFGKRADDFPLSILTGLEDLFEKYFHYSKLGGMYASLPNPFATKDSVSLNSSPPDNITLVDNSELGWDLPLWSLVQPARNMDFIIAWDNSQDSPPYAWNNGTDIYNFYAYAKNHDVPFPIIPPVETMINKGYNHEPVLFGCDAHLTTTNNLEAPIVLYMANSPWSSYTNYTALAQTFTDEQMAAIMINSFNYMTKGNGTVDAEWPECLGCAAIDRSLAKLGTQRSEQCQRCMDKYCWDGSEDNSAPPVVDLPLRLDPSLSFAEWNKSYPTWPIVS